MEGGVKLWNDWPPNTKSFAGEASDGVDTSRSAETVRTASADVKLARFCDRLNVGINLSCLRSLGSSSHNNRTSAPDV